MNKYKGILYLTIKLYEKLLAQKIQYYFDSNKLFYTCQHGFRKGHKCETALHELLSDLNVARDLRKIVVLLFIEFRKVDTVDSTLLIQKLLHYVFDNDSLRLVSSYFCDRKQLIKRKDGREHLFLDKSRAVNVGIPQGSCLGPLFFPISSTIYLSHWI